ncbi:MAG: aromatic ring-hydroxylating dioxygenase subunit alpha [Hydrogenophilaceae bacterium]|jgi:nitrite reductase/ring-hydroxylating ferredoxin subunit|nr:aromatic ring-hydroxylating dioxygenase subunit alpha [Hydrogenophilaceae bacterium]
MPDSGRPVVQENMLDNAQVMRALERRLVAHIAAGTTDCGAAAMRVSASEYADPARLEAEKRELFRKLPLVAGFSCEIPNPGDVMLFEAAGPSIVVARGRDGTVRAFLNMCMHRGAQVVKECGNRKLMTCRFHGWSYDLEGRLVGMPSEGDFPGEDRDRLRLVQVPAGEWGGLIFVKAHAGEERIDVAAWLGEMAPLIARFNLGGAKPVKSDRIDIDTNWKYALNTYGESYHFGTLHPTTFSPAAFTNTNLYDRLGRHYRVTFSQRAQGDLVGKDESQWPAPPVYGGSHYIFPNTIIYGAPVEGGGTFLHMYRLYPGEAPGKSFTIMSCYRGGDVPASISDDVIAQTHDFIEMVVRTEDYSISAEGQRNLECAPPGHALVFGKNEIALQNVHRDIAEAIGMPLT